MEKLTGRKFEKIPVGPLGIIAVKGTENLSELIDSRLVGERKSLLEEHVHFPGAYKKTFLIDHNTVRFSNGEGKAILNQTVRGHDIYILADVGNYSCTYNLYGNVNHMSPDDHFQDIKRVISAIAGKARRINLIMPLMYQGRQHKRQARESLDSALALQELERMGVDNIITFDAHDPRVQNAIPLRGFENLPPTYQIIKALLRDQSNVKIHKDNMLVISPDVGAMGRCLYYSSMLGLDIGLFYKRRDYSKIVNGKNPIIQHEYLGENVEGKDVLIVDDMISSGESVLDIAKELKGRKANNIYAAVTFGLFTEGIEKFNKYYEEGYITRVFSTNLTYRKKELLEAEWYVDVDMSKFIANLIDRLNHAESIGPLFDATAKIKKLLEKRENKLK